MLKEATVGARINQNRAKETSDMWNAVMKSYRGGKRFIESQ
jgi:hypothetical protein